MNAVEPSPDDAELPLHRGPHINYFLIAANGLPSHYVGLDSSRISAIYFIVVALDLLDALEDAMRQRFIEAIYGFQLHPGSEDEVRAGVFGFIGGSSLSNPGHPELCTGENTKYAQGHIAMIYTALASLLTLGDDLSRVDRRPIAQGLKLLQQPDGSFATYLHEGEADVRFIYCACAIAHMLDLWEAVDVPRATAYVVRCLTYEGGFGLSPGLEAHGGGTYCALAALSLMGTLDAIPAEEVVRWCLQRQAEDCGGYSGRVNKDPDSCYAFWIGASLQLMGAFECTDLPSTRRFILQACQMSRTAGGFRKTPDSYPDIMHSYYSLAWIALAGGALKAFDPALAICRDKADRVKNSSRSLGEAWSQSDKGREEGGCK